MPEFHQTHVRKVVVPVDPWRQVIVYECQYCSALVALNKDAWDRHDRWHLDLEFQRYTFFKENPPK
jgi:hypothetical protein